MARSVNCQTRRIQVPEQRKCAHGAAGVHLSALAATAVPSTCLCRDLAQVPLSVRADMKDLTGSCSANCPIIHVPRLPRSSIPSTQNDAVP